MKTVELKNPTDPSTVARLEYCDTFGSKLRGLMFRKALDPDRGIVIVEDRESRMNTAIHMFFMNFDITVLWLNKDLIIVDKVLAKKWRPMYFPQKKAKYVVELHESKFADFEVGQQLEMNKIKGSTGLPE